jgi:hypothetical protein
VFCCGRAGIALPESEEINDLAAYTFGGDPGHGRTSLWSDHQDDYAAFAAPNWSDVRSIWDDFDIERESSKCYSQATNPRKKELAMSAGISTDMRNVLSRKVRGKTDTLVEICSKLVRIPSETPPSDTREIAKVAGNILSQIDGV